MFTKRNMWMVFQLPNAKKRAGSPLTCPLLLLTFSHLRKTRYLSAEGTTQRPQWAMPGATTRPTLSCISFSPLPLILSLRPHPSLGQANLLLTPFLVNFALLLPIHDSVYSPYSPCFQH